MKEIVFANLVVTRHDDAEDEAVKLFAAMGESLQGRNPRRNPEDRVSVYQQANGRIFAAPPRSSTGKLGAFKLTSGPARIGECGRAKTPSAAIYARRGRPKTISSATSSCSRRPSAAITESWQELDLFSFHPIAPGSRSSIPRARSSKRADPFIRRLYDHYGYGEVITPQVCDVELWKRSGHYEHYRENLFFVEIDERQFGVKPMNCPGHTYLYSNAKRSYRRAADPLRPTSPSSIVTRSPACCTD